MAKYTEGKKIKMLRLIFAYFFHFSISHSNVIDIGKFVSKDFPGTTVPRILKFGINVGYDLLYCVKENQPASAYHCLIYPFFFLSKQMFCYKFLSFYESQSSNFVCIHIESGQEYCGTDNKTDIYFAFFPSLTPM